MIRTVVPLLKTLFDIIRLQKGPDAIPRSGVLVILVVFAWLGLSAISHSMFSEVSEASFGSILLLGFVLLAVYSAFVVFLSGSTRLQQTLTAIIGCGALLQFIFIAGYLVLTPFLGSSLALAVNWLISFWSVPVEGHIIARATDRHWLFGLSIAIAVLILQFKLIYIMNPIDS